MATWMEGPVISRIAGQDLTGQEGKIVTLDSNGNVVLCGSNGKAIGVLVEGGAAGQAVAVRIAGTARVVAGAAIAAGDYVMSDADAQATPASAPDVPVGFQATVVNILGVALGAANAGELVEVLISPGAYVI